MNTTEFVIYGGAAKRVKKSGTAAGTGTDWGEITGGSPTSVVGKTLGPKKYFFRISYPGGKLKGELSKKELSSFGR
ncbi:MAG TPA: hypothetical protein VFC23_11405 [Thermoanaerobaculia bacterium]|nr:hypothetical protein [Thermoanaerobaculia bacterium]